jgi:hypothetical protein
MLGKEGAVPEANGQRFFLSGSLVKVGRLSFPPLCTPISLLPVYPTLSVHPAAPCLGTQLIIFLR